VAGVGRRDLRIIGPERRIGKEAYDVVGKACLNALERQQKIAASASASISANKRLRIPPYQG